MDIVEKYFSKKDIEFIQSVRKEFDQKLFFECSDKFIYSSCGIRSIEKRFIVGIKCDNTKIDKYFAFMNIKQMKLDESEYNTVYMGRDISNNFKKIYFENCHGIVCFEVDNNQIDVKKYTRTYTIPDKVLQSMPEQFQKIVKSNTGVHYVCNNQNRTTYHFILKNAVKYNEDFSCWVFSIAYDENWKILYHTYYLRLKKIHEDNCIDPIFHQRV